MSSQSATRFLAVAKKEGREILRDPITLLVSIFLPLVMMFLFSYAITLDVKPIDLAIVDEDNSPESRDYIARHLESGYFRIRSAPESTKGIERLLDRGKVRMVLVVPSTFSRDLRQGRHTSAQVLLDGSFPNTALIALNYADGITQAYSLRLQRRALAARYGRLPSQAGAIEVQSRVRYNPALRSENFIIPGLFAVILMAFPPLLTALAVVRESEQGSIQHIYMSPIQTWEFFFGKLAPYAVVAFVEMLLLLVAAVLWFQVPVRGSVPLLLALSVLYIIASCGFGLVVSTWTRSQVVALLLAIVLTFMPAFLFSGFLFAIESMPPAFQGYTYLFPARYFTEIARGIVLKGAGIELLWIPAAILVAYSLVLLALAAVRFRKTIG
jgi:ABC-2 type transport system permease protein